MQFLVHIAFREKGLFKMVKKPNWKEDENVFFLEDYGKCRNILQSKLNPAITNMHKLMWQEVKDKINARKFSVLR